MPYKKMDNELSDEDLMLNYAIKNCINSFTHLFERHNRNMIGFIIYQSKCSEDIAQDIVASTWEKLIKSKHTYKPLAKFRTYLYTILHNTQTDYYRKNNKFNWSNIDEVDRNNCESSYNQFVFNILQTEIQIEIYNAINSLSNEQALVITLYYLEGFKIKEIADITEVSVECVKSRLRYAKKGIRKNLLKNDINSVAVKYYLNQLELSLS